MTTVQQILRFKEIDQYGNPVFIVSNKFDAEEKKSYKVLKKINDKLIAMKINTFLPVYCNQEYQYCSVRFKYYKQKTKLNKNDLYTVDFILKKVERDEKSYINAYVNSIRFYKKGVLQEDTGEILDLEL